jgi:hypothetical protein
MSPIQGAMAFMPLEGIKAGTGKLKPTPASVTFNPETDTQFGPMDAGDDAPMSGANMRAGLEPTAEMTGLGGQFNMKEGINYDPYKTASLIQTPATNNLYRGMFDPNSAKQRRDLMNSRLMRVQQTTPQVSPYYNFDR